MSTEREQPAGGEQDQPHRSRAFFESLLANAGDVMTLLDENGVMIYHSPAITEMIGIEPDDAIGIFAPDMVHRDDRDRVAERIHYCLATPGSSLTEVFRLPHIDGTWRWVEAEVRNLLGDPAVEGILVVSRDITRRQRLEEHFSIAETAAGFGTYRWDRGTDAPAISHATVRLMDLPEDWARLPVAELFDLIHPDDADKVRTIFNSLPENPKPFSVTMRLRRRDGTYRHFISHGFPEVDGHGEISSVMGVVNDITDNLNTELTLKRTEAQYRLIAEHAQDMFARHGRDGRLTFISPAVTAVLGFDPEDLIGQDIVEHMHPDDQDAAREQIARLGIETDSIRLTYRVHHRDGHLVWLESTVHAIYNEQGEDVTEAIAVTRDVSERKNYELQLLEAREKAEAANRTKSTFLANMSHELRTPLNAIIGFSEILKRELYGPLGDENYSDYAGLIYDSGSHLLDLINDILDMSKVEAGKMEISLAPIDIQDVAETCLKLVETKSAEKNLNLELTVDPAIGGQSVLGDLRATKQIMLNLLSNAVKFTGEGGTIRIDIRPLGEDVELRVSDNGIGIKPEDIPRLLKPFEQVVGESSLAEEGSGLGLALTKSFCELQGGSFELDSDVGVGTSVRITLPKAPTDTLPLPQQAV